MQYLAESTGVKSQKRQINSSTTTDYFPIIFHGLELSSNDVIANNYEKDRIISITSNDTEGLSLWKASSKCSTRNSKVLQ